jgi:hypothetical protein
MLNYELTVGYGKNYDLLNVRKLQDSAEYRVIYPFEGSEEEYMFSIWVKLNIDGIYVDELDVECIVKLSMEDYCRLKLWYSGNELTSENPICMTSIVPKHTEACCEVNGHLITDLLEVNVGNVEEK